MADTPTSYFSSDYSEARNKFLAIAEKLGATLDHRLNPKAKGPSGEDLYADVALFGSPDADKFIVIMSGTHGNEGFCGSGCQIGYLEEGWLEKRPADTSLLFVHAINPYGFAHVRRVTEDNVDINRNFVDHDAPYPHNDAYEKVHAFAVPEEWANGGVEAANKGLAKFGAEHGPMELQRALSGGQYAYPNGIFFGGNAPTWSNLTLRAIVDDYLMKAKHVALIDFHTGLGPNGHGELILSGPHAETFKRASDWYGGEVTSIEDGSSASAKLTGMNFFAFTEAMPAENYTGIAVEYGTYDTATVLQAMRFDNWINQYETPGTELWNQGKKGIRDALYCDNDEWKAKIWERATWVLEHCYAGLAKV